MIRLGGVYVDGLDKEWMFKGIVSQEGRLFFINTASGSIVEGLYRQRFVPVALTQRGFTVFCDMPHFMGGNVCGCALLELTPWDARPLDDHRSIEFHRITIAWEKDTGQLFLQRGVAIPWWMLTAVFSITPARQAIASWKRYGKPKPGHCRKCGYDLRASSHRCPECGTAIASDDADSAAAAPTGGIRSPPFRR